MQYTFLDQAHIDTTGLSFWQSPDWHDLLQESGQVSDIFYFGDISGSFVLVEIRSLHFGWKGAFILGVSGSQVGDDWDQCIEALMIVLRERGVILLQIEPLDQDLSLMRGTDHVYKKFLTPYTRILDLTADRTVLLSQMHEKGRYNIRYAERQGVEIREVDPTSEHIDIWMELLHTTTSRGGFSANSRIYYESFLRMTSAHLYFAYFGEQVIAAGIFVFTPSRAIYYYGASTSDRDLRKKMSPYLLQWYAIEQAKQYGSICYDFLGVADPHDPHDPLMGVSDFKEKFGGTLVGLPKKILIPLSWRYQVLRGLKYLKKYI